MSNDDRSFPPQHQSRQPGFESEMDPQPIYDHPEVEGCNRLRGRVALISGGDSGIGRAVAVAFAKEGADVCICYLDEHEDAEKTRHLVEDYGRKCEMIAGDIGDEEFCRKAVQQCVDRFRRLDILVNNAAEQYIRPELEDITSENLERVFKTNVYSIFYLTKAALPHLNIGSSIINTTSVVAYRGNPQLLDYSATKGAIVTLTRSLSQRLCDKGIRVNAVAPGPIWTPLIPASFPADKVAHFGEDKPMGRAGQPVEVASCFVFLASNEASYITGQVLHPNGGAIING